MPYPAEWEDEYKREGFVKSWIRDFPTLFIDGAFEEGPLVRGKDLGRMVLFAQYALMYLLRKQEAVHSLTWYSIVETFVVSKNRERTERHRTVMQDLIGAADFNQLRGRLLEASLKDGKGEPDSFCWSETGKWFFAEAKWQDHLLDHQFEWFRICREVIPEVDIRVYRLHPSR